jgi:hypothetical protein
MQHKRLWGTLLATAALAAMVLPAAHAGSAGRRNTTIILGGVAAYELLKGNTAAGAIAGVAAAGAYERYRDAKKQEEWYDSRYRRDDWYDGRDRRRAYREDYGYRPSDRYDRDRDDDRNAYRYDRANYRYRDGSPTRSYRDDRGRDRDCR